MAAKKRMGLGYHQARNDLGLAVWQMKLALEYRLLTRHPDGSVHAGQVQAALDNLDDFKARLHDLEPLNLTQGTRELNVSRERLARVIDQVGLEPALVEQVRMYGRITDVRQWRRGDLLALAPHLSADVELRAAATAIGRSQAARKAARTRAANKEARQRATETLWLATLSPTPEPLDILALYAAWHIHQDTQPAPGLVDQVREETAVRQWVDTLNTARLDDEDRERLSRTLEELMAQAGQFAFGPPVAVALGVDWGPLADQVPHLGLVTTQAAVDELAPDALAALRAQRAARLEADAVRAEMERVEREHQLVERDRAAQEARALDAANQATKTLPAEAVAELFDLGFRRACSTVHGGGSAGHASGRVGPA